MDIFTNLGGLYDELWTKGVIEIATIFVFLYFLMRFMEGTRGAGILKGIFFLIVLITVLLGALGSAIDSERLDTLQKKMLEISVIAVIIIFHPELRRVFTQFGQAPFLKYFVKQDTSTTDEIVYAVKRLSSTRTGGIIALAREIGLGTYIEGGIKIDGQVSVDLICTVFFKGTPLHDGALIIREDRIVAAACLFPLTENPKIPPELGTRHRAAIGVTEESDAICVVVSEETGRVSLTVRGSIETDLTFDKLRERLDQLLRYKSRNKRG